MGPYKHYIIFKERPGHNASTNVYTQLKDAHQQPMLIFMMNGFMFHGVQLVAFNCYDFHFDQVMYHLEAVTTKCLMCENFHKHVRNQEQQAIQQRIDQLAWRNRPRTLTPSVTRVPSPTKQHSATPTQQATTLNVLVKENNDDSKSVETLFELLDLD